MGRQGLTEIGRNGAIVTTNFPAGTILLLKNEHGLSVSHKCVDTRPENGKFVRTCMLVMLKVVIILIICTFISLDLVTTIMYLNISKSAQH